ncbi:3-oxoacid CoA-transferase subunit B [Peribacillus cavernae]|uniref:3-oxoacid CoA-transferase subunit B n=1 Tax=Peribacillus cavernae TaxID=1674310 RepID=A0A3S0VTX5_9BACI|nr:3-oxoacid CoA-transferase subunit B [Peribacillus cavernae]MDQ0217956.1 acetate CoA/acetoacetate CoA-transferase beta subunit [Peribacillus cavernae]RUQ32603.1 3-oxoacid CoA-transferase subunit B [Peribacillus cavernae]
MGLGVEVRHKIARRAAMEIKDGMLVNLGIGIPSLVPDHLPADHTIMFHAENGIVGMGKSPDLGKEDAHLCNAGGYPVTLQVGASYCDSTAAFGMIRKGLVDVTILGALQVSESGDLANWIVPGKRVPGMGGAMELAAKAKKVIVLMNHREKTGSSKLVKNCTLPQTAKECVHMVITEMGVFSVLADGLLLTDLFAPFTIDDIKKYTEASFQVSDTLTVYRE